MPVELRDNMTDLFEALLAGPNAVKELTTKEGQTFYARSGTRSERNRIEAKYAEGDKLMDAIAATLYFLVAKKDGSRMFEDKPFKEFESSLDYDVATEMALLIRRGDEEDDMSIDERTEEHLKNSTRQKEAT